jgi:putative ABC transport system permease protein
MSFPLPTLRDSWRAVRRTPGSSLVAVLTLACGIGANAVVFSALRVALLTPPPVADPDRLLSLTEAERAHPDVPFGVSFPAYRDWREGLSGVADLAAYVPEEYAVSGAGEPARVQVALVSASFFGVTGVRPVLGRVFTAEEDRPGGAPVVVASHAFWRERLGEDTARIGTTISVGGHAATVVGVLPAGFDLPGDAELYAPLGLLSAERWVTERRAHVLSVLARLAPGASRQDVETRTAALQRRAEAEDPGHVTLARTLQQALSGDLGLPLALLQAAAGFLLAIACVNLAGVLAARVHSRTQEWAVRRALGASAASLFRLALGESLLLASLGALAGLFLAGWAAPLLAHLVPDPRLAGLRVDPRVVAFGAGVALLAGLAAGLIPARAALRAGDEGLLGAGSARLTASRGARRLQAALLAGQVAAALVLLVGAALLIGSLRRALGASPGFRPESLLTLRVTPPPARYDTRKDVVRFFHTAAADVRALPGVSDVGAVSTLPVSGPGGQGEVSVDGREVAVEARPSAGFLRVLPGYFEAIGVPLVEGRDFDDGDDGSGEYVTIVTEGLARRLWPGESAIGRRIKVGPPEGEPWLRVIGVVGDLAQSRLDAPAEYQSFEPLAQRPRGVMRFAVRTAGAPEAVLPSVIKTLRALEPQVVLDQVATMDARIGDSLRPRRLQTTLVTIFAFLAAAIAALGVYGVASFAVAQRRREIGVRMALGATPRGVLRFVLGQGLLPAVAGLAAGSLLAVGFASLLRGLLYGVKPLDPAAHLASVLVLGSIVVLANLAPALRAAHVSPAEVLREE